MEYMQIARFKINSNIQYGLVEANRIKAIKGDIFSSHKLSSKSYPLNKIKLLCPCQPTKIVATGLNYKDHARELSLPIPQEPILFLKALSSLIGEKDSVIYPKSVTQLDYEAELGIVIKKRTKDISPKKAKEHILGYTCLNDITARDLQIKDGQWTRAKCFDTFCPVGPFIVDKIDPDDLRVRLFLNGEEKQSSSTKNLIFPIYELVSFISKVMTLLPGDVIASGTPGGVGPMAPGDEVRVCIEKVGELTNYVIAQS